MVTNVQCKTEVKMITVGTIVAAYNMNLDITIMGRISG